EYLSILLEDRAVIPNLMNQLRQVYPRIIQVQRLNGYETAVENRLKAKSLKAYSPILLTEEFFTEVSQTELSPQQKQWVEEGLQVLIKGGIN
ncbi:MAG: exonuclease SbcCD subunit D C-terminal domain-containing protein, partial [Enterococcus sp.]